MDNSFTIGGRDFKLSKIDTFKQFHIVRRIAPILADMLPAMKGAAKLKDFDSLSEDAKLDHLAKFVTPIMMGMSKLKDEDADMVLFGLLSSAEIKQAAGNYARVATPTMLMIQDLELPILFQIAGRAFMYNLSGFFNVLPHQS